MRELLEFILDGLLGKEKYEVKETNEEGRITYGLKTNPENMGLIIGKGGRMIKSIRNLLKVRATLEKSVVNLNIEE